MDVDCLVLLDRVDREDDRAITDLIADLIWQIAGVVISPMVMSVTDFEAWKARERRPEAALREDLAACTGFMDRARAIVAASPGLK